MSIFGKLDAANIPTNPFWVEKGEYSAEVTKAEYKFNRDQQKQLFIEYTITSPESQFLDSKVPQFFTLVDPEMTQEAFAMLPAEEQKAIRRTNSALKRTLCGNDNNPKQRGLGVNPDDLNDENWDPGTLVGTKVDLAINNYGATSEGVAVRWVNLQS
jgi:hypothetical protein